MTYITLSNDMQLMVTKNTPIYRGDNLSSSIIFLLPVVTNNVDLSMATVFLSYIRADGEPDMIILERSTEKYNSNYYQYIMPITCKLSRYPGHVCMWLQICSGGTCPPTIAKSGECVITIHESKNLDNCMYDHQLTAIYQLKTQVDNLENQNGSGDGGSGDSGSSGSDHNDVWEDM